MLLLGDELVATRREVEELRRASLEAEHDLGVALEQLLEARGQVTESAVATAQAERESAQAAKELQELRQEVAVLRRKDLESMQHSIDSAALQAKVVAATSEAAVLADQLAVSREKEATLRAEVTQVRETLASLGCSEAAAQKASAQDAQRADALAVEVQVLTSRTATLKAAADEKETLARMLSARNDDFERITSEKLDATRALGDVESHVERVIKSLEDAERDRDRARQRADQAQEALDQARAEHFSEVERLRAEVASAKRAASERLRQQEEHTLREAVRWSGEVRERTEGLNRAQCTARDLERRAAELQAECDCLSDAARALQESRVQLADDNNNLLAANTDLRAQLSAMVHRPQPGPGLLHRLTHIEAEAAALRTHISHGPSPPPPAPAPPAQRATHTPHDPHTAPGHISPLDRDSLPLCSAARRREAVQAVPAAARLHAAAAAASAALPASGRNLSPSRCAADLKELRSARPRGPAMSPPPPPAPAAAVLAAWQAEDVPEPGRGEGGDRGGAWARSRLWRSGVGAAGRQASPAGRGAVPEGGSAGGGSPVRHSSRRGRAGLHSPGVAEVASGPPSAPRRGVQRLSPVRQVVRGPGVGGGGGDVVSSPPPPSTPCSPDLLSCSSLSPPRSCK